MGDGSANVSGPKRSRKHQGPTRLSRERGSSIFTPRSRYGLCRCGNHQRWNEHSSGPHCTALAHTSRPWQGHTAHASGLTAVGWTHPCVERLAVAVRCCGRSHSRRYRLPRTARNYARVQGGGHQTTCIVFVSLFDSHSLSGTGSLGDAHPVRPPGRPIQFHSLSQSGRSFRSRESHRHSLPSRDVLRNGR